MMHFIRKTIRTLIFAMIGVLCVLLFLLTTTPGLFVVLHITQWFIPGKLEINIPSGRLIDHFGFKELNYTTPDMQLHVEQGELKWQILDLLQHQLTIQKIQLDSVCLNISTPAGKPVTKTQNLVLPNLPLRMNVQSLSIHQLKWINEGTSQMFHAIEFQANFFQYQWRIAQLKVQYLDATNTLTGQGTWQYPYDFSGTLQLHSKQHLSGKMRIKGNAQGLQWEGQTEGDMISKIQGKLQQWKTLDTTWSWQKIHWPNTIESRAGKLRLSGELDDLHLQFNSLLKAPMEGQWQIEATRNEAGDIQGTSTLATSAEKLSAQFGNRPTLHIDLAMGHNQIQVSSTPSSRWNLHANLPELNLLFPQLQGLKTGVTLDAHLENSTQGKLNLIIQPGRFQPQDGAQTPMIAFQGGKLTLDLTPTGMNAEGKLTLNSQAALKLHFNLPKWQLTNPLAHQQKIEGNVEMKIPSLAFLPDITSWIKQSSGQCTLQLIAKGTLEAPNITGDIHLTNAAMEISKINLNLSPIQMHLHSQNNVWTLDGKLFSAGKPLLLEGKGNFAPEALGNLHLIGDAVSLMNTPEYQINISPNLTLTYEKSALALKGSILVPSAHLKPLSFSNTINLTDDAVFTHQNIPITSNPTNLTTQVDIKMGQDVNLDVIGLHGFLDGAVQFNQLPNADPSAIGELRIRDGKYTAYGQDLVIQEGALVFTGSLITNPGLRIRAVRYFKNSSDDQNNNSRLLDFSANNIQPINLGNKTTVGIEVSGRLNAHKITLFSIPATLSQADILSMLLLGKPANQASKSGGQLLLTAISAMNLDSGANGLQLIDQLKRSLGIDFNLQNSSNYNKTTNQVTDHTAFVVGKSITNRLYLSYNIGLLQQDSNVLTLKYLLNRFFSVQVTTSTAGNGIDLLYTHSKE